MNLLKMKHTYYVDKLKMIRDEIELSILYKYIPLRYIYLNMMKRDL